MAVTYYALLTTVGAGKLANATALGTTLKITQLAVGDGGGSVPTPDASRTALVNAAGRRWRRRSANREVLVAEPPDQPARTAAPDVLLRAALLGVLRELPARQRAVVALRYLDDYAERDVAAILGCSVGTVKTLGHRALRRLRADPRLADYLDTVMEA